MQHRTILFLIVIALVLSGCFHKANSATSWVDDLDVEVWANTLCAQPGDTVTARATVTNHGSSTFKEELIDQPPFDLTVWDEQGKRQWSDGKPSTPDLLRLELQPGQSKTIEMQRVIDNQLTVIAHFVYSPGGIAHKASSSDLSHAVEPRVGVLVNNCPGILP